VANPPTAHQQIVQRLTFPTNGNAQCKLDSLTYRAGVHAYSKSFLDKDNLPWGLCLIGTLVNCEFRKEIDIVFVKHSLNGNASLVEKSSIARRSEALVCCR
jgi:hypothetical protein